MVTANIGQKPIPFLVDTGADVSLIPYDVVQSNQLPIRRNIVRQPVMVDVSTALRCEGTIVTYTIGITSGTRARHPVTRCFSGTTEM